MKNKDEITFQEAEKIVKKIDNWKKRKKETTSRYETYEGSIKGIESSIAKLSGTDTLGGNYEAYYLRMNYQERLIASFEYGHLPKQDKEGNPKIREIYCEAKQKYEDSRPENIKFRKELSDIVNKLTKD
ncbi:MAG: hypothetical protein KC516_00780 [Nanoarchaeota archaeon]|nr:hypothetical protein [Nanoarchaeota archaeon]